MEQEKRLSTDGVIPEPIKYLISEDFKKSLSADQLGKWWLSLPGISRSRILSCLENPEKIMEVTERGNKKIDKPDAGPTIESGEGGDEIVPEIGDFYNQKLLEPKLESYPLEIGPDSKIQSYVEDFDFVNSFIFDENIKKVDNASTNKGAREINLVSFSSYSSGPAVIEWLDERGMRPATIDEVLKLVKKNPGVLGRGEKIIALGSRAIIGTCDAFVSDVPEIELTNNGFRIFQLTDGYEGFSLNPIGTKYAAVKR